MSYSTASQVVARQIDYFIDRNVLIAGELDDDFALELQDVAQSVQIFTTHFGHYLNMKRHDSVQCHFGAELQTDAPVDMVLLYWPKAKAEAEYLLAMLMAQFGVGTEICIVGENRNGVRSAEALFANYGPLTKYDSARRCSFYWGRCDNPAPAFNLQDWFRSYPIQLAGVDLTIRSLPGVFSHGELDKGSELLLNTLPKLRGDVLDFGCGAGVIGVVMKAKNPHIELELTDISALAIASAKETFRVNQLAATFTATDVYASLPRKYDYLISNPPFHSGRKTFYEATEQFIAKAPEHLKTQGQLIIVANGFLSYPDLIERTFGHCQVPASNTKFKIYQA